MPKGVLTRKRSSANLLRRVLDQQILGRWGSVSSVGYTVQGQGRHSEGKQILDSRYMEPL